ncbi:PAS domain S-box protein [Cellulophaga sp. E16_2]|uniref:PAS domain S-box protein n=1 Tax=unclassified Cellulophaga TaxID=2634405 RepID=UPI0013FD475C|nr:MULTISPECIES: PAS domain S-box protein [unclassified Cellulophaga]MBO0592616.1 PAS domain S-box protein [Cellulophaga sp. E16_2]
MVDKIKDNELFKGIFESSIEGILVVDQEGNIIKANPSIDKMFGYEPGELVHKKVDDLIPPHYGKSHENHRKGFGRKPVTRIMGKRGDIWGLKKNGLQIPLEISLSPTEISSENLTVAFVIDISDRLLTQKSTAANAQKMNEAQSLAHVGSWVWNLQTNERSWSDEFYRICGLPVGDERLTAKTASKFIHPDDQQNVLASVDYAIKNCTPYSNKKRIIRADGTVRHIMAHGKASYDLYGKPLEWFGTIQDVTEQKETEQQLEENLAKNKALLGALPDMMFILNHEGKFLDCYAPEPEKLFAAPATLIGGYINELLPKHIYEAVRKGMDKTIESEEIQFVEYDFEVKGGRQFYEGRIVPMDKNRLLTIIRDITAERVIENILYVRNRALAATANGIIICDAQQPDFPIIYGNEAFTKITGYEKVEFMGQNCRFLQGDDTDQIEIKKMSAAIKKGEDCRVVLRNYRKDGSLFWNEISITSIYNTKKILTHYVGVQNDVTAHKIQEFFKIGQSHVMDMIIQHKPLKTIAYKIIETIETAIPNCQGSILLLDQKSDKLKKLAAPNLSERYTKAIEKMFLSPENGSCGTAAYLKKEVIVSDTLNDPLWEAFRELAIKDNIKACWSFPIFSSNKELLGTFAIYLPVSRKPLDTEKEIINIITQAISVAIDQHNEGVALKDSRQELAAYAEALEHKVAERTVELKDIVQKLVESNLSFEDQIQITKTAENNAIASQKLLDTIFKNFPRGFVGVVDLNLSVVFIEGEDLDVVGFRDAIQVGATIDELRQVPIELKKNVKKNIQKTLKGEHCSFEVKVKGISYLVNTTPLFNENHEVIQALLVYNNISDQKRVEVEIRNTLQKEKELNELKSRFISMASHEFRTPLSTVLSATNLIERQNEAGQEEKRIKYISKIKTSIKNLVGILNDFLSLSKLEEGKVIAQPILFDFVEFSDALVEELQGIKKTGQEIAIVYSSYSIQVQLDPKLLRHIVHNLLTNAIKYSEENTKILLIISTKNKKLFIEVTDQGIGIPDEDQGYLFQRFYRAKNATNFQGTGLGLNIVQQYVLLMRGNISFQSKLNHGTTFIVELPLIY